MEVLQGEQFSKFLLTGKEEFDKDFKLAVSAACLLAFTQDNFTGPDIDEDGESFRLESFDNERWKTDRISVDGIELNANVKNITLLIVTQNFLEDLLELSPDDLVSCPLTLVAIRLQMNLM